MRIAVLASEFPVLSETPFLNQITGLVRRGHEVSIFAERPQAGVTFHPDIERLGLAARYPISLPTSGRWHEAVRMLAARGGSERRVLLRTLDPLRFWRRAWTLEEFRRAASFLPAVRYDACYAAFGQDGLRALRLQRSGALAGPLAVAFRGADITKFVAIRGTRVYRALFRRAGLLLPVCDAFARRLLALGAPPERVVVHRTGIDLTRWPWQDRRVRPPGPLRLLTIGRLVEKKGIGYVLDAVRRLGDRGVPVEYELAGEGPLRKHLEAEGRRLGIEQQVRFLGWQSQQQVHEALDRADLLVAASVTAENADEEGIPNVLKEAMAVGVPVVSTRHGGIPELVEHGVSGILVPERDAQALAVQLAELAAHPERRAELADAGRARVEQDYDIERLNDRLATLFAGLSRRPGDP
ncbi:MAG TPA: glycosyltransferase [Gemmatimonadales bacterium]|nr:glycosyltransferase [Gemmatimonadales bacterium]